MYRDAETSSRYLSHFLPVSLSFFVGYHTIISPLYCVDKILKYYNVIDVMIVTFACLDFKTNVKADRAVRRDNPDQEVPAARYFHSTHKAGLSLFSTLFFHL